jgi:pSer/pThr/pTyr-binding forkhead associated (FHA) protein
VKAGGYLEVDPGGGPQARLEFRGDGPAITRPQGAGEVLVNGKRLQPQETYHLKPGDVVRIGDLSLSWRTPEHEPSVRRPATSGPAYRLVVNSPGESRDYLLQGETVTIGRAEENDIAIATTGVSREHARLEWLGDGYEIVDLGSTNGLKFQNRRVERKLLASGDSIALSKDVSVTFWAADGEQLVQPGDTLYVPKEGLQPLAVDPEEALARHEPVEWPSPSGGSERDLAQPPPGLNDLAETVLVVRPEPGQEPLQPFEAVAALAQGAATAHIEMADQVNTFGYAQAQQAAEAWQTTTPHLVIHLPPKTWQVLFDKDHLSIGRAEDNDVVIDDSSVSHQHAIVERRGHDFIVRDTKSQNGVWLGRERIESRLLANGDAFSVGRARIVFKGSFKYSDLTLVEPPQIDGKRGRRPVVFVPGLGGSELWLGSEKLYPVARILLSNPQVLALPGDPRMEARQIVSDVVIVPGVLKQEQYSRLGDYLVSGLGYTRGKDLLEFPYDWRQDVRLAAQRLAEAIDGWGVRPPVTIIAHSLGTLVTRYYVERLGGKKVVERIILMGGPHYGTPKGLLAILYGPGLLPLGIGDEKIRQGMATFPSAYQILPIYPSVFDQDDRQIDILDDPSWLPTVQRPHLQTARTFRSELGMSSSVPTVSIFGYGFKTTTRVKIGRSLDGSWGKVDFVDGPAGDLSVPAGSAVLPGSEIHPVYQEHGALYVDNDVKMRLKVELTRSTTWDGKR